MSRKPLPQNNGSWAATLTKDVAQDMQNTTKLRATDSFVNPTLSLGLGGGNALGRGFFTNTVVQNFQWLTLRAMYSSNGVTRRLIEMEAEDMTRQGIEITGKIEPDKIQLLNSEWVTLEIWQRLFETICMARLYGGAIAVIDIEGQLLSSPLDLSKIGKGQFKGLQMFDRWQLTPSMDDYGALDKMPNYYEILSPYDSNMKFNSVKDLEKLNEYKTGIFIHRSRVIRFDGDFLPYIDFLQNQRWYSSVFVSPMDDILGYVTSYAALAVATYKSSFRYVKIKRMYEVLNQGSAGRAYENLMTFIQAMKLAESSENVTVLSDEDEIGIINYDLTGMIESLNKQENKICTIFGYPETKLLGKSAQGMNSTGDNDTRMYYDTVANKQKRMSPDILKLLKITYMSVFGAAPPEDLNFNFMPLWQMDQTEKSTIAKTTTDAVNEAVSSGLVNKATGLKELKQSSETTGVWSNISDEEIEQAEEEDENPPTPDETDPNMVVTDNNGQAKPSENAKPGAENGADS